MAETVYYLTADDLRLLKDLLSRDGKRQGNVAGRGRFDDNDPEAPEVYVARAPEGGIPAMGAGGDDGTGTASAGTASATADEGSLSPGYADCQIYLVHEDDGEPELEAVPELTHRVHNLSDSAVAEDTWFIAIRDKFGKWFVASGGGSEACDDLAVTTTTTFDQPTRTLTTTVTVTVCGQTVSSTDTAVIPCECPDDGTGTGTGTDTGTGTGTGTVSNDCCPDMPANINATLEDNVDATCLDGTVITLAYIGANQWRASTTLCGHPVTLTLTCYTGGPPGLNGVTFTPCHFYFDLSYDDDCGVDPQTSPCFELTPGSCSDNGQCSPFHQRAVNLAFPQACGADGIAASFHVDFTEA